MEFQEKLQIASADFNRHFEFLVSEFGYSAVEKSYTLSGGVNMVHVFRNELAEKQIEIAGNLSWFHTEIRRLLKAKPADYDDNENCIGYESLAILESNGDYDHWKYFVPFAGWENVINNTISLFLRNKTLLTSKNWVDNALLKKVKRESFFKLTGLYPDDTSDLHELLIRKVVEWFGSDRIEIIMNSRKLAPFHINKLPDKLEFTSNGKVFGVYQKDWRDLTYMYTVFCDRKLISELDRSGKTNEQFSDLILSIIKL